MSLTCIFKGVLKFFSKKKNFLQFCKLSQMILNPVFSYEQGILTSTVLAFCYLCSLFPKNKEMLTNDMLEMAPVSEP